MSDIATLEMELNAILEHSYDNILITNEKGVILKLTPNSLAAYGCSAQEMVGKTVYEMEREGVFRPSVSALVIKHKKEMSRMQTTATGRMVMVRAFPVFDELGTLRRVVSITHDMTDVQIIREEYEYLKRRLERRDFARETETEYQIAGIKFRSRAIRDVYSLIERVAVSDSSILFLGESGVGKTAFAKLLHQLSPRKEGRFVELNCSSIPEALFESELFGYEGGAFTGANRKGKVGLIEQASHGTLFLDEVGEMPLPMQAKLLKVLQDRRVMPVGGTQEREIDFRLITATNQNLGELVKQGKFRLDLYYRLNVVPVSIPPLRDRKQDIPVLVNHFLERLNKRYNSSKVIHPKTIVKLTAYHWPGNVRELENVLERLFVSSPDDTIKMEGEWDGSDVHSVEAPTDWMPEVSGEEAFEQTMPEAVDDLEKRMLMHAKQQCKSTYAMARKLGISQPSVVRKLKKYRIS